MANLKNAMATDNVPNINNIIWEITKGQYI